MQTKFEYAVGRAGKIELVEAKAIGPEGPK
jgi:hypothetical protein